MSTALDYLRSPWGGLLLAALVVGLDTFVWASAAALTTRIR